MTHCRSEEVAFCWVTMAAAKPLFSMLFRLLLSLISRKFCLTGQPTRKAAALFMHMSDGRSDRRMSPGRARYVIDASPAALMCFSSSAMIQAKINHPVALDLRQHELQLSSHGS